jgi:hypothetical protein
MEACRLIPQSLLCIVLVSAGCRPASTPTAAFPPVDAGQYYAIVLSNGAVYFGKPEGLGTRYPVLHDVYYLQGATNPETKASTTILVKRGKEWHGPDRMIVNENSILFIEPVGPDSKVAKLIAESKH